MKENSNRPKTAIYARVSDNVQTQYELHNLKEDMERLGAFCIQRGYRIVDTLVDADLDRFKNRDQILHMCDSARACKYDVIFALGLDRLIRNFRGDPTVLNQLVPFLLDRMHSAKR